MLNYIKYVLIVTILYNSVICYSQEYLKFNNINNAISKKSAEIERTANNIQRNNAILDLIDLYRIKGNIDSAIITLKLIKLEQLTPKLEARYFDIRALIFYSNSDIEQAKIYWDKSYNIKQSIFNNDSSIFASTYLYYSKYYMQLYNHKLAFLFSEKAIKVLPKNDNSFISIAINREYAYNLKYKLGVEKIVGIYNSRKLLFEIIKECKKLNYNFYLAKLYHDIGNTYTDIIGEYVNNKKLKKLTQAYNNAHYYYNLDIDIRSRYLGKNNDLNGITWYTKGLLERYSRKSKIKEISFYNKAIKCYFSEYLYLNNVNLVSNKIQVLEILQYKIFALISVFKENKDTSFLFQAKRDVDFSVNLWQNILETYKSFEISKVLGSGYNTMPFDNAIKTSYLLYDLTKKQKYLNNIFQYSEMQKHALINRDILAKGDKIIKNTIISLKDVQSKLKKKQVIIEYNKTSIILINKDSLYLFQRKLLIDRTPDSLVNAIKEFDLKKFINYSYLLYKELILPVKNKLKNTKELIIVPYYKINIIPFDCLISEASSINNYKSLNYLINDFNISYAYSATLKYMQNNVSYNNKIYGVSPQLKDNKALPFSEKLFSKLSEIYEGNFSKNEKIDFFNNINNYSIVHIATHTELNNDNNSKSKIIIGNSNESIEIQSFYKHKIKSQLAVILACESASGDVYRGDETNSFVRAFKYAGVPSIISTLWKVDDKSSNEILDNFYKNLLDENNNMSTSLHKAKIEYLANAKSDEDYNPYYWSGIIFTGSDVKIRINKKHNYLVISILIISILIVLILFILKVHLKILTFLKYSIREKNNYS